MSKYYKAEDVISFLNMNCPKDMWEYQIADLPTIEVSEDAISREQLKSLSYINKGNFNSVEGIRDWIDAAPSVISQVPNEDAVRCYEFLKERIGSEITDNPKEFEKWFERMVFHVRKCNEYESELRTLRAPSVVPKPKEGEWQITDAYPHNVYCSKCHKKVAQTHWAVWKDGSLPRNFCPNCGVKMKGVEEE